MSDARMSVAEADEQLTRRGRCSRPTRSTSGACEPRCGRTARRPSATILASSRAHGDAVFLVYEDERITFEEHFRAAAHLAHILRDRFGVENGDRVAIAMRNFPEWSVAFWAAAAAGAVVVPLNAWWTGEELHYGLADSGSQGPHLRPTSGPIAVADYLHLPARPAHHRRGPGRTATCRSGCCAYEDVLGEVPADVELPDVGLAAPTTTPPSSTPPGPPDGPKGRSAPTATSAPTRSASSTSMPATPCGPARQRRTRARWRQPERHICCRCRCFTPPGATRSW